MKISVEEKINLINKCEESKKNCYVSCDEYHAHSIFNDCISSKDEKDLLIAKLYAIIKFQNRLILNFEKEILNIGFDITD